MPFQSSESHFECTRRQGDSSWSPVEWVRLVETRGDALYNVQGSSSRCALLRYTRLTTTYGGRVARPNYRTWPNPNRHTVTRVAEGMAYLLMFVHLTGLLYLPLSNRCFSCFNFALAKNISWDAQMNDCRCIGNSVDRVHILTLFDWLLRETTQAS